MSIADLPEVMQQSGELDIYPLRRPELAEVIDGAIGEGSPFHATFGYYAQGVAPRPPSCRAAGVIARCGSAIR